ncbi:hypothetical protein PN652_16510, partial [Odoribacter splanchnicus]|uniref:hypothetical protein n=1 Tax=Odoribacter splanchnicus TaxID=28118 RepID=UPI00232DD6DC
EGRRRWESGERTPDLIRDYVLGVLSIYIFVHHLCPACCQIQRYCKHFGKKNRSVWMPCSKGITDP